MAFKDITKVLYDGSIKLDYKDSSHRYYVRERIDYDLPETDPKAWGKAHRPKGVTTVLDSTLEKKGLMTWPMGVALANLFGFYDFTNEKGDRMTGFSKDKGTLWNGDQTALRDWDRDSVLDMALAASKVWQDKQKKGADIGSVVHDAIEHYIKDEPFDIAEQYLWNIKEHEYADEADRARALEEMPADVEMAMLAYNQAVLWWERTKPELYEAEMIVYSKEMDIAGTLDMNIGIDASLHPVFKKDTMYDGKLTRVTGDWKTSNASKSEAAAMPEGINYQYIIQDALYECARREMGLEPADDLLVVSVRKDGGFTTIYASELGLTVDDCISWAKAVVYCCRAMEKTKRGLIAHAEENGV